MEGVRTRWVAMPILLSGLAGAVIAWSPWFGAGMISVAAGAVLIIVLCRAVTRGGSQRERVLRWGMLSFALHLVIGLTITYTDLLFLLGPDAQTYHAEALQLARSWTDLGPPPSLSAGKEGFTYLLGALYWMLGPHSISGVALNAAFGAALVPLVWRTTQLMFGDAAARFGPPLIALLPAFALWPSQLLREAPILFLVSLIAAVSVGLAKRFTLGRLIVLVGCLILLLTLRASIALVLAGSLTAAFAFGLGSWLRSVGVQFVAGSIAIVFVFGLGFGYAGLQQARAVDLEEAENFRNVTSQGAGSGFDTQVSSGDPGVTLTRLPIGLARVMVGPFPWDLTSSSQLVGLLDAAVWILLLPVLASGVRHGYRQRGRAVLILLLPAVAVASLLAVVVGNYGLLLRERTQVMVFLIPFFCLGLARRSARRHRSKSGKRQEVARDLHSVHG